MHNGYNENAVFTYYRFGNSVSLHSSAFKINEKFMNVRFSTSGQTIAILSAYIFSQ